MLVFILSDDYNMIKINIYIKIKGDSMKLNKRICDFRAKNYIDTNYIKNGKAVISMKVKDNQMFYNELDADSITLSREITDFIDKRIDYIPYKYEIVMQFYCKDMLEDEKKKIKDMLKAYYGLEANEKSEELKRNNIKSFILFIMGVFFLLLASLIAQYGFLLKEIISIAGWVAIWEMVTSVLFDTIKIKLDKLDATNLCNAEIIFLPIKQNRI
jgi:nitrate reductase NapE component